MLSKFKFKMASQNPFRKELSQCKEETDKELKQVTALLNSYASLGDEFQAVVKEFTKVKEEIDNRKWALGQLD